jgi:hypothetical protein
LGPGEANGDNTNYWVFSSAGLRRILQRTGWTVCDYLTVGCTAGSDPVSPAADERALCLLRSRIADREWRFKLLRGWHRLEQANWRWTERSFSAILPLPVSRRGLELNFRFYLPVQHLAELGAVTLASEVNGCSLPAQSFSTPGHCVYSQEVPDQALSGETAEVAFLLDRAIGPTAADRRERGLVVPFFLSGNSLAESEPPLAIRARG